MADQVQMGGEPPVTTTDPLVVYLYLLLREGAVAPGEAEGRMLEIEGAEETEFSLCNRFLASYAENLAKRLKKITPPFDERGRIVQLESALVRLLNHSPPRHQQDPAYLAVIRWARDMYNGEDPFKLTRAGNCPDCGEAPACENPHTPDGDPCSHPCHGEARS